MSIGIAINIYGTRLPILELASAIANNRPGHMEVEPIRGGVVLLECTILETPRCILRPIEAADTEALYRIWSDVEVTEYLVMEPFQSMDQATEMIDLLQGLPANDEGMRWVIEERCSARVIGTCGFHRASWEHRKAEIGYEIARVFWGQGLIQEALKAMLNYCFLTLNFNRLEALVTRGNQRSSGLLASLGFIQEGILRDYEWARGCFQDQVIFSQLQREWELQTANRNG